MVATERNGKKTLFGQYGKLSVKNGHLVGEDGSYVQLKGVSTHNMNSFPEFVNDDAIEFMADNWGMQLFRLAMYSAFADGDDGYSDGSDAHREELENIIIRSVKKCAELGIYVMVDWHILFDYDPNMHKDMALKFFEKMVPVLSEYDNVIYEICNEPSMDVDWAVFKPEWQKLRETWPEKKCSWDSIKAYANEVIPVIRKAKPDCVIVCGTTMWSQGVDEAADSPLEFENMLYALHFYATTHKQSLRDKAIYALKKGIGIYVTEYGICDAAGSGDVDFVETARWIDFINENKLCYTVWNLSNKNETSAMIKPDCKKLTGWTEDELSVSGKWFVGLNK
ncbi:MAG: glycoside hydrolase family 5 protein [Lachnospiraceae bacterium]|nr:glycoside hydrolase family 5 protein [Lachnospiraceae bacterium]